MITWIGGVRVGVAVDALVLAHGTAAPSRRRRRLRSSAGSSAVSISKRLAAIAQLGRIAERVGHLRSPGRAAAIRARRLAELANSVADDGGRRGVEVEHRAS